MSRIGRVTLADVARRAGVSRTTASYILNGRSAQMRISAATERRVQQAMRELDYHPNWSARTLRGSTTRTFGLVSDQVASGGFASELVNGASATARARDHLLVIGETLGDRESERLLIEELLSRQVDGIIYATLAASRVRVPERLRASRVVLLNCEDPGSGLPAVLPDDLGAGRAVADLITSVDGPVFAVGNDDATDATAGRDRMAGLTAALVARGRMLSGVVPCPWDVAPAREAVAGWLRTGVRPGALVCLNDRIAMGAYQALADNRLRVGVDVSVVSFDGSVIARWLRPTLTSLAIPFRELGARAVEMLVRPDPGHPRVVRLPLRVQHGTSVVGADAGAARMLEHS